MTIRLLYCFVWIRRDDCFFACRGEWFLKAAIDVMSQKPFPKLGRVCRDVKMGANPERPKTLNDVMHTSGSARHAAAFKKGTHSTFFPCVSEHYILLSHIHKFMASLYKHTSPSSPSTNAPSRSYPGRSMTREQLLAMARLEYARQLSKYTEAQLRQRVPSCSRSNYAALTTTKKQHTPVTTDARNH